MIVCQVREPYTSVKFLAERIPVVKLLKIKHPELDPNEKSSTDELKWSAYNICDGIEISLCKIIQKSFQHFNYL